MIAALTLLALSLSLQEPSPSKSFIEKHCLECHDADNAKGGLDLAALQFRPADPKNFTAWVKIHDRVRDHEMPPEKRKKPEVAEIRSFLKSVADPLVQADAAREAAQGRSVWRRLNRYEYENTLRDLLQAPWLQIRDRLPEDGEAHRFNKAGEALDVSHVQMAQYLAVADYALHEVLATQIARPESTVTRYYARDQKSFANKMKFNEFNRSPERATFPVLGDD